MLFNQLKPEEMTPDVLLDLYEGDMDKYYRDIAAFTYGSTTEITDASNHDSPSRNNMAGNHIGQTLPTVKTGKRTIWNGPERDYGLHGMSDVKVPEDADVLAVIPRYAPNNSLQLRSPYEVVIYSTQSPGKKAKLGFFTTKEYGTHTLNFGYKLDFSHSRDSLHRGGVLTSDYPVGRNTAMDKNGDFQYAHECNVLFTSHNIVSEDQYWACKETVEDLFRFYLYNESEVNCRADWVPLDLYHGRRGYQPCPLPGQAIRSDGLLMGFRQKSKCVPWIHLSEKALKNVYVSDRLHHVEAPMVGIGHVYDIEVVRGRAAKAQTALGGTTDILNELADLHENYYERVLEQYQRLLKEMGYHAFDYEDCFTKFIAEAYIYARQSTKVRLPDTIRNVANRLAMESEGIEQGDFNIRFTCVAEKKPNAGDKYTDTHGTKGISAKPTPRKDMPRIYLPSGQEVVADFALSWLTVIKRMNTGQMFTFEVNYFKDFVLDHLKPYYQQGDWEYCFREIMAMYECVNPKGHEYIARLLTAPHRQEEHTNICMEGGLVFYNPNHYAHSWLDKVLSLQKRFPYVEALPIHFRSKVDGTMKVSKMKGKIATKPMLLLEKHPEVIVCSTSLRQHHGQPATTTKLDRTQHQIKKQSSRGISETEGQLYTCTAGPLFTAESFDRTANVATNAMIVDNLLAAIAPTNVECLVNRMEIPLGNSNMISLLKNKFNSMGFDLKQMKKDEDGNLRSI